MSLLTASREIRLAANNLRCRIVIRIACRLSSHHEHFIVYETLSWRSIQNHLIQKMEFGDSSIKFVSRSVSSGQYRMHHHIVNEHT